MAETLVTLEEASKELQLSKEQIVELANKGLLRGIRDQRTLKFRAADIEAYKKRLAGNATSVSGAGSKGDSTETLSTTGKKKSDASKIDLTEIDAEPTGEDKDQTSVLVPADERGPKQKPQEAPVFQFSEKDLGLQKEEPSAGEEGDQTSLLMPAEEKPGADKESKPSFDFAEKGLAVPADVEEASDSVLVADESESSVEVLEVTEESSSESASSSSGILVSDEPSSGEGVKVPAADAGKAGVKPAGAATDKTVTDILGPATEESDEALETLEVDEVVDTREAVSEEAPAKPAAQAPAETETVPVAEEFETVGLPAAEETKAAMPDTAETAAVSGAVAEALAEAEGEEEKEEKEREEAEAPAIAGAAGAWETVIPSKRGNGFLIAATVMFVLGGVMLICEMSGIHNSFTAKVVEIVKGKMH